MHVSTRSIKLDVVLTMIMIWGQTERREVSLPLWSPVITSEGWLGMGGGFVEIVGEINNQCIVFI